LRVIAPDWAGVILGPAVAGGVGTRLAMRGTAQTVNGGECQKAAPKVVNRPNSMSADPSTLAASVDRE
jgi:hypothetical protein